MQDATARTASTSPSSSSDVVSSHDEDHQHLARGVLVNVLGILAKSTRPIFLIAFSRILGVELFGLYLLAFAIQEVVSKVVILGLNWGVMRVAGVLKTHGRTHDIRRTVERVLLVGMIASGLGGAGLALAAGWISSAVITKPELAAPLALFALGLPFLCGSFILLYAIRPTLDMRYEVLVRSVIEPAMILIFGVAALLAGYGVEGIVVAHNISAMATFFIAFYYLRKVYPRNGKKVSIDWSMIWHSSAGMGGMELLGNFKLRLDLMVIGRFLPLSYVGAYGAIVEIATLLRKSRAAFDPILMPITQKLHLLGERARLGQHLALAIRWSLFPALFLLGTMWLLPELYLGVFGRSFLLETAALTLILFTIGQMFHVSLGLAESVLAITGFAYVTLVNSIVLVVGNLILLLIMVPKWGMLGAAGATTISFTLVTLWRMAQLQQFLDIKPFERSQAKPVLAWLVGMVVAYVANYAWGWSTMGSIVINVVFFTSAYFGTLFLLKLEPQDSDILRRGLRKIPLTRWINRRKSL